jgi:hypothetical protein
MEDNVFEMEYTINGEKYLITARKVEDNPTQTELLNEMPMTPEDCVSFSKEKDVEDGVEFVSIDSIPEGMDITTWLDIIERYGIVLTK